MLNVVKMLLKAVFNKKQWIIITSKPNLDNFTSCMFVDTPVKDPYV
jgi:hypothetical protein